MNDRKRMEIKKYEIKIEFVVVNTYQLQEVMRFKNYIMSGKGMKELFINEVDKLTMTFKECKI